MSIRSHWWFVVLFASLGDSARGDQSLEKLKPFLGQYCYECHLPGKQGVEASGFDMSSYQSLMKGGKFGPLIKPGDAFTSAVNMLVEGRANPSIRMPHHKDKLPDRDTDLLKRWVNEGAKDN